METGISIIVPVYNVEKFLKQCVESIINQDYPNIQVILIDDGSTDNSRIICDSYARKYNNIVAIHQENAGVSAARNRGLEIATKEYVCFVDSDDVLSDNAFRIMNEKIQNVDLVITGIQNINEAGTIVEYEKKCFNDTLSAEEMSYYLFMEENYGYQGYITNKLFRNNIIQKNNIRFSPSIKYNEDRLFILEYIIKCKDVKICDDITYYYRKYNNSAMGKVNKEFQVAMLTELDAFEKMKILVKNNNSKLFQIISRVAFEKSLYWLKRIPTEYYNEKRRVRKYLYDNAKVCMKIPEENLIYKIKLIAHCILEQ